MQRGQEVADGRMNNDLMPLMLARARGTIIKGLDCLKITESHNKHRERKKKKAESGQYWPHLFLFDRKERSN